MEQIIQLTHPAGKKAVTMARGKYDAVRKPLLDRLRTNGESTHKEILAAILDDFNKNKTKFEGSVEWHMEWVKLDLESRQEIKRLGNRSPMTFVLAGA